MHNLRSVKYFIDQIAHERSHCWGKRDTFLLSLLHTYPSVYTVLVVVHHFILLRFDQNGTYSSTLASLQFTTFTSFTTSVISRKENMHGFHKRRLLFGKMLAQRLDFAGKTIKKKGRKSQRCKIERAYTFCGQSKHKINVNSLFSNRKNGT